MRDEKFRSVRDLFIDTFEREARQLNDNFDNISCRAYATFPSNDFPPGKGYFTMFLDCLLDDVPPDKSDSIALGIMVFDKNNRLTINADICWGDPTGVTELEAFDEPVEVSDETLTTLQEKMPAMICKLRELIETHPNGL